MKYVSNSMKWIIPILLCFFMSIPDADGQNHLSYEELNDTARYQELYVIREICESSTFSFCGDGICQHFATNSRLIAYDREHILKGYKSAIFFLFPPLPILSDSNALYWVNKKAEFDSIIAGAEDASKPIVYFNRKFKRCVNNYYRRSRSHLRFNGYFYFKVYKISVRVRNIRQRELLLPNIYNPEKRKIVTLLQANCYLVTEIKKVEAIVDP